MGGFSISGSKGSGNAKIIEYDWNQKLSPSSAGENLATTRARQLSEKVTGAAQAFAQQRTPANYKKLATAQADLKATTANGGRASANFEPRLTTGAQFDTAAIAPQVLQQTNDALISASAVLKEFEVGRVQTTGTTGFAGQKAKSANQWSTELSVQQAYVAQVNAAGVIEKRAQGYVVTNVTLQNPKFGNAEGQAASAGFSRPIKNLPIAGAKSLDQALSIARTKINSGEWNGERMIMIAGAGKPVEQMNGLDKIIFALQAGAKTAGPAIQQEIMAMFTVEGMAQLAAFAAASSVPVLGQLMSAGMVAVMLAKLGPEAVKFINGVWNAARATSFTELQTAGDQMSGLIARVVVEGVPLVGMKGAAKVVKSMPKVELKVGGKVRTIPRPGDVINNLTAPVVKKGINRINKKAPRAAEAIAKVGNSPLANEIPVVGKTIKAIKKEIKALEVNGGIRPLTSINPTGAPARTKLTLSGLRDLPQNHAMNRALIALEKLDLGAMMKNAKPGESIKVDSGVAGLNIEIAQVAIGTGTAIAVKVRAGKSEFSYTPGYDAVNKRFNSGDVSAAVIAARTKSAPTNASGKASNVAASTKTESPNDSTPKGAKAPAKVEVNAQLVYLLRVTKAFASPGDYRVVLPEPLSAKVVLGHTKALAASVKATDSAAQRRVDANARSQIDWRSAVKESITELDGLLKNSNAPQPAKVKERVSHLQKKLDLLLKRAERNDWAADAAQVRNAIALTKRPVADFLARDGVPMATLNQMASGQPPLGGPLPPPDRSNSNGNRVGNAGYSGPIDPAITSQVNAISDMLFTPAGRNRENIVRAITALVGTARTREELLQIRAAVMMDVGLSRLIPADSPALAGATSLRAAPVAIPIGSVMVGNVQVNRLPKRDPNTDSVPLFWLPEQLNSVLNNAYGVGRWKFQHAALTNSDQIVAVQRDGTVLRNGDGSPVSLATVVRYPVPISSTGGSIETDVVLILDRQRNALGNEEVNAGILIPRDEYLSPQDLQARQATPALLPRDFGKIPLKQAIQKALDIDPRVVIAEANYQAAEEAARTLPSKYRPPTVAWVGENVNAGMGRTGRNWLAYLGEELPQSTRDNPAFKLSAIQIEGERLLNNVQLAKVRLEIARHTVRAETAVWYDKGWKQIAQISIVDKTIDALNAGKSLLEKQLNDRVISQDRFDLLSLKIDSELSSQTATRSTLITSFGVTAKALGTLTFERNEKGEYDFGADRFPGAPKQEQYSVAGSKVTPITPNLQNSVRSVDLYPASENVNKLAALELDLKYYDADLAALTNRAKEGDIYFGLTFGTRAWKGTTEALEQLAKGNVITAGLSFVLGFVDFKGAFSAKSTTQKALLDLEQNEKTKTVEKNKISAQLNDAQSSINPSYESESAAKLFNARRSAALTAYAEAERLGAPGPQQDIGGASLAYAKYLSATRKLFESSTDLSSKAIEYYRQTLSAQDFEKILGQYEQKFYPDKQSAQAITDARNVTSTRNSKGYELAPNPLDYLNKP